MTTIRLQTIAVVLAMAGVSFAVVYGQAPAAAPTPPPAGAQGAPGGGGGGRGGGRGGGLPGATPDQMQAVMDMVARLAPLTTAVTTARNELATATFADAKNEVGIRAAVDKLRTAELALATSRADEFAKLQAGPNKLNPEQVTALINAGGAPAVGRGGGGGGRGEGRGTVAPGQGAVVPGPTPGRGN